jgi:alpha-amylase/alpha-mannosidase (GH57 family)
MDYPLNVAFIWHFHQPYYKDNYTNEYLMPWTRLHGTKDYLYMAQLVKNFPDIKCTFNYSPSLLTQLKDYSDNFENASLDIFLRISKTKAAELSAEDKIFIINKFFSACRSSDNFIKKSKHFYELSLLLSNQNPDLIQDTDRINLFSEQDYTDIIVLFNLLWIDPLSILNDKFLNGLKTKDYNFTEEEKGKLINIKIPEILKKFIPAIQELINNKQIELSGSPFYHPILPLLCDTGIATFSNPNISLPKNVFRHSEDAEIQIKKSIEYFNDELNYNLKGMWPSEGSVSENAVNLMIDNKLKWIATDEDILANSIGINLNNIQNRKFLYRPYIIKRNGGFLYIFFRDRSISDLVGFKYANYDPKQAAAELINYIKNIHVTIQDINEKGYGIVSIILDGENAWEYYRNNALDFFNYLYEGLSKEKSIKTVTISEYLESIENESGSEINDKNFNKSSNNSDTGNNNNETSNNNNETAVKKIAKNINTNTNNNVKINGNNNSYSAEDIEDIKWNSANDYDFNKLYNIPLIYPGSWIDHNFNIWIGDDEDNKSWDLLSKTRDWLVNLKDTAIKENDFKKAWEQIYVAEGSDYNWWYGDDRTSGIDDEYDALYRTHLSNIYRILDKPIPDEYFIPIFKGKQEVKPSIQMVCFINPTINGYIDNYFEWLGSAVYFPALTSGKAMAHSNRYIRSIRCGFNKSNMFFRIDFFKKHIENLKDKEFIINFLKPNNFKIINEFKSGNNSINVSSNDLNNLNNNNNNINNGAYAANSTGKNNSTGDGADNDDNDNGNNGIISVNSYMIDNFGNKHDIQGSFANVLELSVPLSYLNINADENIQFYANLSFQNNSLYEIERIPVAGYFDESIPNKNYEIINWIV